MQVVRVWPLLGEDESDLGGRGDFGVCQDGGDEDAGVEVGVAGVEDVGGGGGGLGPDVGAVASGLRCLRLVLMTEEEGHGSGSFLEFFLFFLLVVKLTISMGFIMG